MSSNIYEVPKFTMNVKYNNRAGEDRGQREERLVDIYQGLGTDCYHPAQLRGGHIQKHRPAVQRSPIRAAALVLGLVCLLLLVGAVVLSLLYISKTEENNQLSVSYDELQTEYRNLSKNICQGNVTEWKAFKGSCYYKSTEMKNWTESKKDCETRGAQLVIIDNKSENDFIKTWKKHEEYWIGLEPVRTNDWKFPFKWKWLDGSSSSYKPWKAGVNIHPVNGNLSSAFLDVDGNWNQTNGGSKGWICEKSIN